MTPIFHTINGGAVGSGQVEGDKASGKFDATVDIEFCSGSWTAERLK